MLGVKRGGIELLNVLKGEVNLVGPRPIVEEELRHSEPDYARRVSLDVYYIDHWSIRRDPCGRVLAACGIDQPELCEILPVEPTITAEECVRLEVGMGADQKVGDYPLPGEPRSLSALPP